ncbi:uncharacterized protein isoform X2 [Salmo salar]|uniref:Uncharacterized protein isoform X2 n=1 Tax=Salmo salar TaxID=8030 RepID=A0ABM3DUX6_SALSA|nr:uncharacterized protein LOC106587354 isoform X2 [Salmo salar]
MDRNHKPLRIILLKAGTLQASAGEQVLQKDGHSTGHDGLSLPALVGCPQDSPRKAGTLQASAGEQVLQTDVHSTGHDGLSLPALVDCPQDSPRKAGTLQASAGEQVLQTDVHSTDHDGLSLPALVDCPQDSPRKAGTLQASAGEQVLQTDVHSTGHDGLSLPALVDCPQDSPRKAGTLQASAGEQVLQTDVHSTDHDGLSLPALVDCPQDSPRKAGTLQASAGEQVLQTDVHSAGHGGHDGPALVDCPQDSPRKNLVPKPPQGPRPSREANIAKAENKAREAIKARRAREAKAGGGKLSHQVVGMLALPQTLLSRTSYSVLPAIKKGTKVTKMETTEPLCPLTPDGEIMISSSSVDDLLTLKSDVMSEAKSDDASRPIEPEMFSLTNFLKSHPKRKLIRKFLKQMNVTIGDLDEIIEWVVCVSNEVFLPVMALIRTSSPESSTSSRWGSGELQIISREFHQRSSEPKGRLLGGQPPTPPSETDKELQGVADLSVSNILKRAQEDLFFSGEDDLENTHPGITLTEESLSSIFSELFRDACESAQEATRQIHHMRSGRGNNSRNGRCPGLSQGSSRSNMLDLGELGSVRRPKGSDVHKVLSEGSLPVFALLGERPGEVGETSSPAGEMDATQTASTPSIPQSGHGSRRSSQTTAPITGHREAGVTASNIFDVIFHLTHSDTDRKHHQEFSSEDDVSLNDIMDMKLTPPVEPLGQILSSWKLVNRIFRGKVHYFGKELICKVYQMLLDTGMGRRPMARQSRSEPILKDLAAKRRLSDEFFTDVLYMFIQRAIKNLLENFLGLPTTPPGRDIMWNDNFNWMYRDGWGDTPTSSKDELWDSDSTWSSELGEEEGAESRGRWAALLEKGSFLTLQSPSSLSDDNKEALGAVYQVLTTRVGDILNSTCNDDYKARLIIQKGLDSGARERFPDSPCSSSPKDEEEVVVSGMTVSYPKPSTSTQAAWAAPAQTLDVFLPRPCLDEEEVVPSTSMKDDSVTTTHAARAAPYQTLEEEVGGAEVSEMSDSSLMPTKNRQDPLQNIPSLLPGKEDILLRSTPWTTVMSPQTLKFILHGIMCQLEASESPQTRRANDPFRLMKDLFVEVQHALKYADISVVFGLEESIQFSGEDAVKAIVKTAAKRLSLRSDANRAQLCAARSGSEGAIGCMADTITQVIDDYSEDWSSDGHFGARRSHASGRSYSSTSSRSDVTLTEELLAWKETLEGDLEEMADDITGLEKTSVSSAISEKSQVISYLSESTKPISSALSTDLEDITSTQKEKEEAMEKEVRKSGKKKRGNNKDQKKNKVSPLGNDSTVAADEPKKKQALLPRITAALAKLFCFPCKKKIKK